MFALPFALTGALLALHRLGEWTGTSVFRRIGWIVVAMVAARSAAMGFNRLADASHDALNPRTAMRELPRGLMTRGEARAFVAISSMVFVLAAWQLGPICFALSPVALAIVFWYSLAKRFTTYTQLFLGLAMAVAPVGGWLAAGGRGGMEPWLLACERHVGRRIRRPVCLPGSGVRCARTGCDRFRCIGVARSLVISRAMHVITVGVSRRLVRSRISAALSRRRSRAWPCSFYEQSLSASTTSRRQARFDLNGYVGILYLATTAARSSPLTPYRRSIAVAVTAQAGRSTPRAPSGAPRARLPRRARGLGLRPALLRDDSATRPIDKLTDYWGRLWRRRAKRNDHPLQQQGPGAKIASGSQGCQGMVVVPCSMKSLAGIAHGLSRNLVERAADVMLKERRPLIVVPRETPMSLPQLRNMVLCAEAGAMIMPAMPAFYQMPKTLTTLPIS